MEKGYRLIAMSVVMILMAGGICVLSGCQKAVATSVTFLTDSDRNYDWPGYTLDDAVEKADHIVYGRVVTRRGPVVYRDVGQKDGVEEPYIETTLQVIRVLKASGTVSEDSKSILYLEIPAALDGGRDNNIPASLSIGQEVILFLNTYSRTLGPDFVIPVENGNAQMTPYLRSNSFQDIAGNLGVETLYARIADK